jgi:hypothetical protein
MRARRLGATDRVDGDSAIGRQPDQRASDRSLQRIDRSQQSPGRPAQCSHARCMHRSLITAACAVIACTAPRTVSRFDDDYEAARQQAVRSKLPLVAEVWAPW